MRKIYAISRKRGEQFSSSNVDLAYAIKIIFVPLNFRTEVFSTRRTTTKTVKPKQATGRVGHPLEPLRESSDDSDSEVRLI